MTNEAPFAQLTAGVRCGACIYVGGGRLPIIMHSPAATLGVLSVERTLWLGNEAIFPDQAPLDTAGPQQRQQKNNRDHDSNHKDTLRTPQLMTIKTRAFVVPAKLRARVLVSCADDLHELSKLT